MLEKIDQRTFPPWTYIIFKPEGSSVSVRLLAADLPSQGSGSESIEARVEVPCRNDEDEAAIRRKALLRLQALIDAELTRLAD